ncbi:MAG: DUF885 domain-containing protein [Rubrivivax sp.]|nr:DUF885 domain-containing protein [Rubrivivax sp.]
MNVPFERRWALALATLFFCVSASWAQAPVQATSGFTEWSERFAADWVRLSPERATFSQYFGAEEQAGFDRELTPLTAAQRERTAALARAGLARLSGFDTAALTADERVGAAILRWSLQRTLDGLPFEDHGFVFNQLGGPHIRYVSLLAENQPLRKPADLQAYLARLAQVDQRLDEGIERSRAAAARGLLPPRVVLERAHTQVQAFLAQGAADNDIVSGLVRRSARIEGLAAEERQAAISQATALVQGRVRPAYERVLALMNELHPRTTGDAGLWRLPQGDKAYAQALANFTTTTLDAEAIHQLGLREVARIEAQMDRVLQGLGRREGSVQQRLNTLRAELQPAAEPDPRPAIIARYVDAVRDAQRRAQDHFNLQPRAPVDVRRVPALTERTASAYYTTPTPDGSRPGIFWMPLPGPNFDLLRVRSLAVHEAVPGHHFQLALQQEQATLPRWRQRRIFGGGSAHSEGWALYAERLALDQGWYEGDPHALLGGLDGQLFRARRLVVDTGLHAKRWTREQAINYGLPAHEVERYIANPGQATAYMVGMLHILALRDEVQRTMGQRFTLKGFHDVVLKTGSVPLDVLSDVVRRWAAAPA